MVVPKKKKRNTDFLGGCFVEYQGCHMTQGSVETRWGSMGIYNDREMSDSTWLMSLGTAI